MLIDALTRLAAVLRAELGATGSVTHAPTKGELREEPLRKGLARHLPFQFAFTKGVVVNSDNEESLSQDVLVVDRRVAGPFIGEAVYPIESVVGTIQVKSRLRSSDVAAAVENVATVSRLVPEAHRAGTIETRRREGVPYDDINVGPFTGLFAYVTDGDPEKVATAFAEENLRLPIHERLSALCLLDVGVGLWASEKEGRLVWFSSPSRHARPFWIRSEEWGVAIFVLSLWEGLIEYSPPRISPLGYFQGQSISFQGSFWEEEE